MNQPRLLLACITLSILLSGCISVDVKPREVISGTVDAGKNVYETIKRRRNGEEERLYTHTIPLHAEDEHSQRAIECLDYLNELASRTSDSPPQTLSETTEVIESGESSSLKCVLTVLVKKAE